jgi:hypothetical protein
MEYIGPAPTAGGRLSRVRLLIAVDIVLSIAFGYSIGIGTSYGVLLMGTVFVSWAWWIGDYLDTLDAEAEAEPAAEAVALHSAESTSNADFC